MTIHKILKNFCFTVLTIVAGLDAQAQMAYKIQGNLSKGTQGKILLGYKNIDQAIVADSAEVKDGVFSLSGTIQDPVHANLFFKPLKGTAAAPESTDFFLEPGIIVVKSTSGLKSASITGGKAQNEFNVLGTLTKPMDAEFNQLDSTYRIYKAAGNEEGMKDMIAKNKNLRQNMEQVRATYAKNHPESFVSFRLWELGLRGKMDAELREPEFNRFSAAIRNSESGKRIWAKIALAKKNGKGQAATDFSLPDTAGKMVALSSFKGKNVLLCFWHRYFMPFETFSFTMTKINRQIKGDDFAMVSVFFNPYEAKVDWRQVLKDNGMNNWTNLNDEKGIKGVESISAVAKAYDLNASTLPQCILIGPDGKILLAHVNLAGDPVAEIKAALNK